MICVLCVVCDDGCFINNVLTHTFVMQWVCMRVPTVTVVCINVIRLAFHNYACVVACDN